MTTSQNFMNVFLNVDFLRKKSFYIWILFGSIVLFSPHLKARERTDAQLLAKDVGPLLQKAHIALDEWRLLDARRIARRLRKSLPNVPAVSELMGRVKFHEGDFEGALKLLRRAAEGGASSSFLNLAESTFKETQDSVTFESEHFLLRVPRGKDEILKEPALWALEKAFDEVTEAFDYFPSGKIAVDVLQDARGLAEVSSLTVKEIETSGTIALCKYNRLMITSPKALARGYAWLDTLSHELVHLVVSEKSHNQVPIWLHEGLAKFSESLWRGQPGLALQPASEALLARAVANKTLITFEQMHPSMAKLPSQNDTALAFAEVFTVIEFLHVKERKKRRGFAVTNAIIDALRDRMSMNHALKKAVGWNLAGLQRAWRRYLKARKFRIVAGAKPKKLRFVRNARTRSAEADLEDDEAAQEEAKGAKTARFVRLGNLLRKRGYKGAALLEYEKALRKKENASPFLQNRVAQLYLEAGRSGEAVKLLKASLKINEDDPHTHVLLGRAALLEKRYDDAKRHYLRARWENPFHPEIDQALLQIAEALKDKGLKERSLLAISLLRQKTKRKTTLEKFGTLDLEASSWGNVFVDGKPLFRTTPVTDLELMPGAHVVRVEAPTLSKAGFAVFEIFEKKSTRVFIDLKSFEAAAENEYQKLLLEQREKKEILGKEVARAAHIRRGLTGIPFEEFQSGVKQVEDFLDDNKAFRAYERLRLLSRQLDNEVEENLFQRQWLLVLEVESLTQQRRFDEAISASKKISWREFRRLPIEHAQRYYSFLLEAFAEKETPSEVLSLAIRCDDEAKRVQKVTLSALCLRKALVHLEAVHQNKLNEIAAMRLSLLGVKTKIALWLQEGARALLLNYQQTHNPQILAQLKKLQPKIVDLQGNDPVLILLKQSLKKL